MRRIQIEKTNRTAAAITGFLLEDFGLIAESSNPGNDPAKIAHEMLYDIKAAVGKSRLYGIKVRGAKFIEPNKIAILIDLDRQYRHPDEFGNEDSEEMARFYALDHAIQDIMSAAKKKHKEFIFSRMGDTNVGRWL